MTLVLDDSQTNALKQTIPLLLSGPPGAGKTAILYNIMLRTLIDTQGEAAKEDTPVPELNPTLFISQATNVISKLKIHHASQPESQTKEVLFSTWLEIISSANPGLKLVSEEDFAIWLQESCPKILPDVDPKVIHYEISLMVALSDEEYQKLSQRQCYFSGDSVKQKTIKSLLNKWQSHLQENKSLDPMVTLLSTSETKKYRSVFCDEAQNLPPTALRFLIEQAHNQQFVGCLDSEQCLISSPYIHNCIKQLLHHHYSHYSEQPLPRTWRCPPAVASVANHLMNSKYRLDGGGKRRNYHLIESAQQNKGIVSWFNDKMFKDIKKHGALAGTVVIADNLKPGEREYINEYLGTNNILRPQEAIGLDYDVVILWKPFSKKLCLGPLSKYQQSAPPDGLTLEQWNALNAIYVSLTRAQQDVYIYEEEKRTKTTLGDMLLGQLPINTIRNLDGTIDIRQQEAEWRIRVNQFLAEGHHDLAREVMRFHLHMKDTEIEEKINSYRLSSTHSAPMQEKSLPREEIAKKPEPIAPIKPTPKPVEVKREGPVLSKTPTSPEPKEVKPEQNPISREIAYITQFLQKVNEANLIGLLEHKNAIRILFDTKLENEHCLFLRLLVNPKWRNLLFKHLPNYINKFKDRLDDKFLCQRSLIVPDTSVLYWFTVTEEVNRLKILHQLFSQNPKLGENIHAKDLCRVITVFGGINDTTSPLYYLATEPEGCEILNLLIIRNPALVKNISAKDLCLPRATEGGEANESPLSWLSGRPEGHKILTQLISLNPKIAEEMTAKDLCLARPAEAKDDANTSPLFWLSSFFDGRRVLLQLLTLNPTLGKGIKAKDLCLALPKSAGKEVNTSPLYWLSARTNGRKILQLLLKLNPNLSNEISARNLCLTRPAIAGVHANSSPLYHLSQTLDGCKILHQLLSQNPTIGPNISAKYLCLARPEDAGSEANESPLCWLAASDEGRQVLLLLLKQNPKLAEGIFAEALCRPSTEASMSDFNTTPLLWLSRCTQGCEILGCEILDRLLSLNPKLAANISTKDLCLARPKIAGIYANQSPLYLLSEHPAGRRILKKLLNLNPTLAQTIPAEAFTLEVTSAADEVTITSLLDNLSKSPDGKEILDMLSEKNQQIKKVISEQSKLKISFANIKIIGIFANPNQLEELESSEASEELEASEEESASFIR